MKQPTHSSIHLPTSPEHGRIIPTHTGCLQGHGRNNSLAPEQVALVLTALGMDTPYRSRGRQTDGTGSDPTQALQTHAFLSCRQLDGGEGVLISSSSYVCGPQILLHLHCPAVPRVGSVAVAVVAWHTHTQPLSLLLTQLPHCSSNSTDFLQTRPDLIPYLPSYKPKPTYQRVLLHPWCPTTTQCDPTPRLLHASIRESVYNTTPNPPHCAAVPPQRCPPG